MIYLDNASTTKQKEDSFEIMKFYACDNFFNPSALYANENTRVIQEAKKTILIKLNAPKMSDLIFTSGATEANNMLLNSFKNNIIISAGEHPSIYNSAMNIKALYNNIKICPLQKNGEIDYEELKNLIDDNTKLVSVIHTSNETGVVNDINKISKIIKEKNKNTLFHSDGVQAFLKQEVNLGNIDIDFYTISAHKIGGPKGIGALFVKNLNKLKPLLFGGEQEYGLRAGTENLPAIMAFKNVVEARQINNSKIETLKNTMLLNLTDKNIKLNFNNSSPYILSLCFSDINSETMINYLKSKEIYVARGSACSSKNSGNRVLEAIGLDKGQILSTIRISFFEDNTVSEIEEASKIIKSGYYELREKLNKR